jgi:Zn-dependent peptidase ImmA (M78 family)/transcriptional regulator with XRE-family HTH domain
MCQGQGSVPAVNPEILTWARETAGLSLERAAHAIQLNAAKGLSGAERLEALENNEGEPSRALLRRMAEKYRRPLLVFYLKQPPDKGARGEDFRRGPGAPSPDYDPHLDALIRNVRVRHELAKSLLEDEETPPLEFIGSHTMEDGAQAVAASIRSTFAFDIAEFHKARDVDTAFSYLRSRLEQSGIFVLLVGNLGSHHSNIPATTFRGYAIADAIAPFIVINDNDAHAAWSSTALHEAAHLLLGQTGISGASHEARIERFCDDVTGRLLLPRTELKELADLEGAPPDEVLGRIAPFASARNISRRMVAYKLLRANIIDAARYEEVCRRLHDDWLAAKAKASDAAGDRGGPSYYVVRRHRLGPAMLHLARRSIDAGALTPTKAAQLLGVKPVSVHTFAS